MRLNRYGLGVHHCDVGVVRKVSYVECQEATYSVSFHGCDQPGIVHLHAGNTVVNDDPFPFGINRGRIGQQRQQMV